MTTNVPTNGIVALNSTTQLAPVRFASAATDVSTNYVYYNGPANDGVGATITLTGALFSIDGGNPNVADRVLIKFSGSPDNLMNGIYICTHVYNVATGEPASVLMRSGDLRCVEQLTPGLFTFITEGAVNAGAYVTLNSPIPTSIGVSGGIDFFYGNNAFRPTSRRIVLTGNLVLTANSASYQFIDPDVSDRTITLPVATKDMFFVIKNITLTNSVLTIFTSGAVQVGFALAPGVSSGYYYDGTAWQTL
jgi:hypothetical protein